MVSKEILGFLFSPEQKQRKLLSWRRTGDTHKEGLPGARGALSPADGCRVETGCGGESRGPRFHQGAPFLVESGARLPVRTDRSLSDRCGVPDTGGGCKHKGHKPVAVRRVAAPEVALCWCAESQCLGGPDANTKQPLQRPRLCTSSFKMACGFHSRVGYWRMFWRLSSVTSNSHDWI